MENLAHSLTGALLGRAGLERRVPFGVPALVVAANLPDADSVAGFWGSLFYFHHHRGITHSLVGIAMIGLLYTALLMGLNRLRKHPPPFPFASALLSVYLVLITHPLMDFTNSYGWRPFLPFQDCWYYGDLVFIVDPYLWLILGGGLLLTARRGTVGRVLWMAGVGGLTLLIARYALVQAPDRWMILAIWLSGLILLTVLKVRRVVWGPRVAYAALLVVPLYWGALLGLRQTAVSLATSQIAELRPGRLTRNLEALPRLATPFQWDLFAEQPEWFLYAKFSIFKGLNPGLQSHRRNREHPAVRAALQTCPGAIMAHFSRYETFEVVPDGEEGPEVILRDVRYARSSARSGFGILTIPLTSDLSESRLEDPCPKYQSSCDVTP